MMLPAKKSLLHFFQDSHGEEKAIKEKALEEVHLATIGTGAKRNSFGMPYYTTL